MQISSGLAMKILVFYKVKIGALIPATRRPSEIEASDVGSDWLNCTIWILVAHHNIDSYYTSKYRLAVTRVYSLRGSTI